MTTRARAAAASDLHRLVLESSWKADNITRARRVEMRPGLPATRRGQPFFVAFVESASAAPGSFGFGWSN